MRYKLGFLSTLLILYTSCIFFPAQAQAAFRFVSWADTKNSLSDLSALSNQIVNLNLNPKFTIYPGDLEDSGFTLAGMTKWKNAINGGSSPGNGMFDITFSVRGNHDSSNSSGWQNYFNFRAMAQRIGATNFDELNEDLTYSFHYGNSIFIGVDVCGKAIYIKSAKVAWIDQKLTQAETQGLKHAFIYFHGPIYWVSHHPFTHDFTDSSPLSNLIRTFNKHPIVSATFHGHEHLHTWTHIDSGRIPTVTHEYEQFVTAAAGAGPAGCILERVDWCMDDKDGFATINVDSNSFTVRMYKMGQSSPTWTKTFSKSGGGTPRPTSTPTPTPTSTVGVPGDGNNDGKVDGKDFVIWLSHFGQNVSGVNNGDYDKNGQVRIGDYVVWVNNYPK